jgi:D-beta-D-heptose 7-phosphate kinase/D-beta-D-heptose 1-phosphate adenosyltransferase
MEKVWVNGTFDVLHIGHIKLLEYASTLGNVRVGIDTDSRVKEKKGNSRPYNSLEDRIEFMNSIKYVNSVVSFSSDEELRSCIEEWQPDVFVIGDDYIDKPIIGGALAKEIKFFTKVNGISTSKILGDETI